MKTIIPVVRVFAILLLLFSIIYFCIINQSGLSLNSEKANIPKRTFEQKMEDLDKRWEYEFEMLKNPYTGKIPDRIREKEIAFAKKMPVRSEGDLMNTYTVLGPTNLGGRTRAFAFDISDTSIMLSGGVSSGIFRSTNGGANWTNVTPSGELHNVTCIAQDTRSGSEDTWYYATGEALGNSASTGSLKWKCRLRCRNRRLLCVLHVVVSFFGLQPGGLLVIPLWRRVECPRAWKTWNVERRRP